MRSQLNGLLGHWLRAWAAAAAMLAVSSAVAAGLTWNDRLFVQVGGADDVPDGVVTALHQDRQGMLWIGTQDGLLRFDGYRFRRYSNEAGNPLSLPGNFVRALCGDPDGRLWIGTEADGLSVFDPETDTFRRFAVGTDSINHATTGAIHDLACASDGGVWIASDGGLQHFDPLQNQLSTPLADAAAADGLPAAAARSLWLVRDRELWVGTSSGLRRLELATRTDQLTGFPQTDGLEITSLTVTDGQRLWLGTRENGAFWFDPRSHVLHPLAVQEEAPELGKAWVSAMVQTGPDALWMGLFGGGLVLVDPQTGYLRERHISDPVDRRGLAFDSIGALLHDRSGLLWVGTWGGGLQQVAASGDAIRSLRHAPARPNRLSDPSVLRILELGDGRLLVGSTGNGIDVIDRQLGVIDHWAAQPDCAQCLGDGVISGLAQTPDGKVWIGTYQGGVYRLDPGSGLFQRFGREAGLPTLQIEYLFVSREGQLWVGTNNGLMWLDDAAAHFRAVVDSENLPLRTRINAIAEADDGRLWVATANGLYLLSTGGDVLQVFRHRNGDPGSLLSDDVPSVLVDRQQRIWVDTAKGFQQLLSNAADPPRFRDVSSALGQPGKGFGGNLMEDADGRIWSPNFLFDPNLNSLRQLRRADGIDVGAVWFGASTKTSDGRLLFGGNGGLVMIDPARFTAWSAPRDVVFSELTINARPQPTGVLRRELQLTPSQRDFTVGFTSRDFAMPSEVAYQYRLLGSDDAWVDVDADHRFASYSHLWPGQYTLQVRARLIDGAWGAISALPIRVAPAFWQTWPFLLFLVAAVALFLLLLVRLASRHHRQRSQQLQQLVDERTRELQLAYARAETASLTDPLSGLGNRRSLFVLMPDQLAWLAAQDAAGADDARQIALLIIDVDDFKSVNDRHGHRAGDQVISAIGALILGLIRADDCAIRWGGEEFLVVARVVDAMDGWRCGERIRRAIADHEFASAEEVAIRRSCSVGFACLPFDPSDPGRISWEHVLEIADAALYAAKDDGRNRVYGFQATAALPADFIRQLRRDPQSAIAAAGLRRIDAAVVADHASRSTLRT